MPKLLYKIDERKYNGIVLSRALMIIKRKELISNLFLGKIIGVSKSTLTRWCYGMPITDIGLNKAMILLSTYKERKA